MNKKTYLAPSMNELVVKLENGFMAGSIVNDRGEGVDVNSAKQEYEEIRFDDPDNEQHGGAPIIWE